MTEQVEQGRKLVTIRTIDGIEPIENADNIEAAVFGGWRVVVSKGEFKAGQEVFFFEIDSALPVDEPVFAFLEKRGTRLINGRRYHVLKTIRLRGVYSQGLVLPLNSVPSWQLELFYDPNSDKDYSDKDFSFLFEVIKWEPPIPPELCGRVEGAFPIDVVPKTDSERVQNLAKTFPIIKEHSWYATEKVDGTSTTYIVEEGRVRVCSRNWEMDTHDEMTQVKVGKAAGIWDLEPGYIIQGETYGEGIQKNPLGIKGQALAVFNVFKGDGTKPLPRSKWPESLLPSAVPVLPLELPDSIDEAVAQIDGLKSQIAPQRLAEGVVWHSTEGKTFQFLGNREGFKVISNKYLSRQKD